ncbi:type 3 dihydrofolate reductase [Rheinheimera sp.]|uniref:type 3 dihydrofolate reductase n=1 Tax=Rheinheimera sp. TaxID=1869214 RepID=UPI00307D1DEF
MKIALIAAMAAERVIGKDNQMPWHLPADLKHFKAVTLGKPVIMGRKTYQSIGKALPGRRNIVISRGDALSQDAEWVNSLEAALALVSNEAEVMVIGGAEVYRQALPLASVLYLTHIDLKVEGDACFPDYLAHASWQVLSTETYQPDEKNPYSYQFLTLNRR